MLVRTRCTKKFFTTWKSVGIVIAITAGASQAMASEFKWPQKYKAAVSLSYDDALDSQLDNAIPSLKKYNLKGTFYIVPSADVVAKRAGDWKKAAQDGHELGNHTLFHQCSKSAPGRDWVLAKNDLDQMSLEQMVDQVKLANTILFLMDGKQERTMTTPCLDQKVANGVNYVDAVASLFVGIKDVGGDGVTTDMHTLNPSYVSVTLPFDKPGQEVTGKELIAIVKRAVAKGTMANFTFHGINGDHLSISNKAHEELLAYLAKNKETIWTDTFLNIMQHVRKERKL